MIAIFAPYGRNEVTAAALRLAEIVLSTGSDVQFIAVDVHEQDIHPFWDHRVRSGKDGGIYVTARNAAECVWFTCAENLLKQANLVAPKARHTLVPSWHSLRPHDLNTIKLYDSFFCPNRHFAGLLAKTFFDESLPATTDLVAPLPNNKLIFGHRWSGGLPFTKRAGLVADRPRVLWHCDANSMDECGDIILNSVFRVLEKRNDVVVTLFCAKSWCRRDRARIRELCSLFGERMSCLYQQSFTAQAEIFETHDLLVLPAVKSDFGITAARGLACGMPVVCYDIKPFTDLALDGWNGVLVPCETARGWFGIPTVVPNGSKLAEGVLSLLGDRKRLFQLQANEWNVDHADIQFAGTWLTYFNHPNSSWT